MSLTEYLFLINFKSCSDLAFGECFPDYSLKDIVQSVQLSALGSQRLGCRIVLTTKEQLHCIACYQGPFIVEPASFPAINRIS